MSAAITDLYIEQGSTFDPILQITDSADLPIDLTGMTLEGHIRKRMGSKDILITLAITILDQTSNLTKGSFQISIPKATSTALGIPTGLTAINREVDYPYDIEITSGSRTDRIMQGVATISYEVTR